MSTTEGQAPMTITNDGTRLLSALRAASALRRESTVLVPDGHCRWFSLAELASERRLPPDLDAVATARQADRLAKLSYVAKRTNFGIVRYTILPAGAALLRGLEKDAAVTEVVAAALRLEQARYDEAQAQRAVSRARAELSEARRARGRARPGEDVLTYAVLQTETVMA